MNWGQWHGPYALPPERLVLCAEGKIFLWQRGNIALVPGVPKRPKHTRYHKIPLQDHQVCLPCFLESSMTNSFSPVNEYFLAFEETVQFKINLVGNASISKGALACTHKNVVCFMEG